MPLSCQQQSKMAWGAGGEISIVYYSFVPGSGEGRAVPSPPAAPSRARGEEEGEGGGEGETSGGAQESETRGQEERAREI